MLSSNPTKAMTSAALMGKTQNLLMEIERDKRSTEKEKELEYLSNPQEVLPPVSQVQG